MRIHGHRVRQAKMESQGLSFHYLNGYATACVVATSKVLIVPRLIGSVNRSSSIRWAVRFDRRYAPVHSAATAWARGPYIPVGTPAGHAAWVASPQAGQTNRCTWYSVTTGRIGGISTT